MANTFTTLMYGALDDVDGLLDSQEMTEAELRAALQRILREVQHQNKRLEKLEASRG